MFQIFGVSGVIICSLKLHHTDDEDVQVGFFKLSMFFAAFNLVLSVLLLISVLKVNLYTRYIYVQLR